MPPRAAAPGLSTASGDARYQPLDGDLTAIAALGTTATGRNKLIEAAPVKDPASPYSVASKVREIVFTAGTAATINLPALSDLDDLEIIWVYNQSASTVTFTVDPPAGAFLNTGADGVSANFNVLARGMIGFQRADATHWGSVQPGSLMANGFRWYVGSGSVWFVATYTFGDGTTIDLSQPLQATSTADPSTFGCSLSGSSVVVPNGAIGVSGTIPTRGQYWGAALSALNLSFPTAQHLTTYRTNWGALTGTRGGASVSICMLTSVSTFGGIQRGVGVNFSTTGLNFNPCWYTSGNLFANVSGNTTTDGVSSVVVQLSSVVQPNNLQRYNAGVYAADYAGSDGNNTTTQFDRAALWIGIATGTVSPGFSLAGLNGTVRWTATT